MRLSALFDKRASVVGGGDPRNPAYWVQQMFGGGQGTLAGVNVSADTALNYSAVWCAITIHGDLTKTLPFNVHQRTDDSTVRLAREHSAFNVLRRRFNPQMSAQRGKKYMEGLRWLWGEAFAEIVRTPRGDLAELWPIHTSRVRPFYDKDRSIWYEVTNGEGIDTVFIPDEKMFRIILHPDDGLAVKGLLDVAAESVGFCLGTERYGASFFGNDARPGGIISHPGGLTDQQHERLEKGMAKWTDPGKRFSTMITEMGGTWEATSLPNDAVQFLETRKLNINDWARWANLPPHMLKDLERATFSNITQQFIEYMVVSAEPNLCEWEDEAWMKLFSQADQDAGYFAEFNRSARLRGDPESRGKFHETMWKMGAKSVNEIRKDENMNGIGPEGDEHLVQMNITTLEKTITGAPAPKPAPAAATDDEDDDEEDQRMRETFQPLMREAVLRLCRKERRWLKTHAEKLDADTALDFFKRHEPMVYDTLGSVVDAVCRAHGAESTRDQCEAYIAGGREIIMNAVRECRVADLVSGLTDAVAETQADYFYDNLIEGLKPCKT